MRTVTRVPRTVAPQLPKKLPDVPIAPITDHRVGAIQAGSPDGADNLVTASPELMQEMIQIEFGTPDIKYGDSDSKKVIRFCKAPEFLDKAMDIAGRSCMEISWTEYFARNSTRSRLAYCRFADGTPCSLDDLPFFVVKNTGSTNQGDQWWLGSIKITQIKGYPKESDEDKAFGAKVGIASLENFDEVSRNIYYWNPCVMKRLVPEWRSGSVKFGKYDVAWCALVETKDQENAETEDPIYLYFLIDQGEGTLLELWPNDDFGRGAKTAYGRTYFAKNPDEMVFRAENERVFAIGKAVEDFSPDTGHSPGTDDWKMEDIYVYLYRPGMSFKEDKDHPAYFYRGSEETDVLISEDLPIWPRRGNPWIHIKKYDELPSSFATLFKIL
jgi:hypothetical protein